MKRREFLAMASVLGLSAPVALKAQQSDGPREVIVIGAGAAGLTAGLRLQQRGINFQILEASATYGGRMKRNLGFADFPLPMGAEWLHDTPRAFNEILANPSVKVDVETVSYADEDVYAFWDGETLDLSSQGDDTDLKFVNSSWFDFFERYVVPQVSGQIKFNDPVVRVDTSSERAAVKTQSGAMYIADAVIVTAPLKMLQTRQISFEPPLPRRKMAAIDKAKVWDGFKAFLEFDDAFYHAYTELEVIPETAGQHSFYDAAYGQNTNRHILGLFSVGSAAQQYIGQSKETVTRLILRQLDEIFDGKATPRFRKIITQDWSNEPFIGGAYVQDDENWLRIRALGKSVGPMLHFAGEAYTDGNDWGAVHNAALSAKKTVDQL